MNVHTRTVISEEWLWHEGCGLAALPCNVLDDVLELHEVITSMQNVAEAVVDLHLSCGTNFMVGALYLKSNFLELHHHLIA